MFVGKKYKVLVDEVVHLTFVVFDELDDRRKGSLGRDVTTTIVHLADAIVLDYDVILAVIEVAY